MVMLNSNLNARSQSLTAQSVSRRAKYEKMSTTTNIGTMGTTTQTSTTVRHLTYKEMKALKTTKFIESKPIKKVKGHVPF